MAKQWPSCWFSHELGEMPGLFLRSATSDLVPRHACQGPGPLASHWRLWQSLAGNLSTRILKCFRFELIPSVAAWAMGHWIRYTLVKRHLQKINLLGLFVRLNRARKLTSISTFHLKNTDKWNKSYIKSSCLKLADKQKNSWVIEFKKRQGSAHCSQNAAKDSARLSCPVGAHM